jgi:hypothetical protein
MCSSSGGQLYEYNFWYNHSVLVAVQWTATNTVCFFPHILVRRRFVLCLHKQNVGRDNSVGITSGCELDGPGIQSRWGRGFSHPSIPVLGPTVEQLIDIAADRNLKDTFKWATLFEFLSLFRSEFPGIAKHIVQHLLPVVSPYRSNATFLQLALAKTKQRSRRYS